MKIRKKYTLLLLFCFVNIFCFAQQQVHILSFSVKPVLPADVNNWATVPGAVILVVQAQGQGTGMVKPVFTIKQGGTGICGNTVSGAGLVNIAPSHNFTVAEIAGSLNGCPKLAAGSYFLCVQFYPEDPRQQGEVKEECRVFKVEDAVPEFCNPPQNMGPQEGKIFTEKDFLSPKIFTWSPFISSSHLPVTYRLTVWEVEEGQSSAQAMYDNLPVLQQEVTGQTRYISAPGVWERRTATYIWRVEAIDREGNLLCKTAVSSPAIFKIVVQEKIQDSLPEDCKRNTPCGNGDFESGKLDPAEWCAGFTGLAGDNSTFSPAFNTIMQPANGNPVDAPLGAGCGGPQSGQNHHVIVSAGPDPTVPTLTRTPPGPGNKYALRLGNNCNGCGAERVRKKFVVTAANATYRFMYALVFEAPHDLTHNPSLWVQVFNSSGVAVPGIVYLDPLSSAPMDRAVSDLTNPYWKSFGGVLYRDWACAKIDLSSLVGQTVTVELMTNDCAYCGHYGYGYFDNFCLGCTANPPDSCCRDTIKLISNTETVTPGNILNIVQNFNLSPSNIKQISAEIAEVHESASDTSCRKCAVNEGAVWNFMPINKAIWNSGTPISGSPVNASGTYPAQHILWYCNQQGNLKLDLKVALPGIIASAACRRTGTIGIRFIFTDKDCRTCEKYIIYNYSVN